MGDLLIRDVDEATSERLKRLAEARQQSAEDAARDLLVAAGDRADRLATIDRIRRMTPKRLTDSSSDLIRTDRDSR